jgi:hypothetical protein
MIATENPGNAIQLEEWLTHASIFSMIASAHMTIVLCNFFLETDRMNPTKRQHDVCFRLIRTIRFCVRKKKNLVKQISRENQQTNEFLQPMSISMGLGVTVLLPVSWSSTPKTCVRRRLRG